MTPTELITQAQALLDQAKAALAVPPPVPVPVPPPPTSNVTYSDTFSTGTLSPDWMVSTWAAPGGGVWSAANVDMSQGMLRLKLQQGKVNNVLKSVGGEVQLLKKFGYGTYEWSARMSSTAATSNSTGNPVSGSVSGLFTYVNDSETEIDFETLGDKPNQLFLTNWNKPQALGISQQASDVTLPGLTSGFHRYKFVWSAGRVDFYFDDALVKTHTVNVPTKLAFPFINHWGTNDPGWGGTATVGVDRYLYVNKFSFTAA